MKRIIMLGAIASIIVLLPMLFVFPSSASSHSAGYAVWVDEDDFLAKPEKPNAYYSTNKLSTENLEGKGYVLCYGDIEVTENVQLARGQNLTIDLGGYKLTASSKIVVNGSASTSWSSSGALTIKNGTIDHIKNQFIQLRTNAEVYFDNITVNEMSEAPNMAVRSGHAFVTDSGGRIISFNNCNITISSSAKLNMFSLSTPFDGISADQAYKDENNKNTDYVRNLIFSNTVFYDKSIKVDDEYNTNIVYVNYADSNIDILNISFTGGSAINLLRDNLFKKEKVSDKSIYNVNISKGCKFTSPFIDFLERDVSYILYDYIEREGNKVNLGNVTELAEYDYENNYDTENTKLIWGNTDSIDFP